MRTNHIQPGAVVTQGFTDGLVDQYGPNYVSRRFGTGVYVLYFARTFRLGRIMIAPGDLGSGGVVGSFTVIASPVNPSENSVTFRTYNNAGASIDLPTYFTAVGR